VTPKKKISRTQCSFSGSSYFFNNILTPSTRGKIGHALSINLFIYFVDKRSFSQWTMTIRNGMKTCRLTLFDGRVISTTFNMKYSQFVFPLHFFLL